MRVSIDGEMIDPGKYGDFHRHRFERTIAEIKKLSPASVLEVGGHPWIMTAEMIRQGLPLTATVSAEEVSQWPDELPQTTRTMRYEVDGSERHIKNYSANIERDWIVADQSVDCVVACEMIEHLVRSPHRMLLNCNQWLNNNGRVVLTTPNGAQFSNPLRTASTSPMFRDSVYKRHNRVFNLAELEDLLDVTGFRVERAEYWQIYPRSGMAKIYDLMARIPHRYFEQKFCRTLFVVARKIEDRKTASRLPQCYAPGDEWDFIDSDFLDRDFLDRDFINTPAAG